MILYSPWSQGTQEDPVDLVDQASLAGISSEPSIQITVSQKAEGVALAPSVCPQPPGEFKYSYYGCVKAGVLTNTTVVQGI